MTTKTLMTAEEFEAVGDSYGCCELVRGEIVRMSPGEFAHSLTVNNAGRLLGDWARSTKRGRVLGGEAGIVVEVGPDTVRGADVAHISYSRLPKGSRPKGFLRVPPDLVVEVLGVDRTWREAIAKTAENFRMGVDRMWVLDPDRRRMHVLRPDGEPQALDESAMFSDEVQLPGFACRVLDFFED